MPDGAVGTFPEGATFQAGDRGWVLAEGDPPTALRALGGALAWAWQAGVDTNELHLLAAPDVAGVLARRAAAFSRSPQVHLLIGREVEVATPTPLPPEPPLAPEAEPFVQIFKDAGADPVVEHGVLVAEVLGLEVARVVDGRLEVGVGKHDREAQKLMHPDRQPFDALVAAVESVKAVRNAQARPHQINQLAAPRWLRTVVCRRPELVGATGLAPVSAPVRRSDDLRVPAPALARGDGVLVACSTGIDLDLVPTAADARLPEDERLVLVLPEVDAHPLTRTLAAALRRPAEIVTIPADWRTLAIL